MLRQMERLTRWCLLAVLLAAWPVVVQAADVTMKMLVVNPSETEVKEFHIRSPLPPEVKPEHVLDADGLSIEYDSQAATYFLIGTVTLKPKQSVTHTVVLKDVWGIPTERLESIRHEVDEITKKLADSAYVEQGRVLASGIERNLDNVETSQEQTIPNPQQHISRYHENTKVLQLVAADLVSLRQLMVMAALAPSSAPIVVANDGSAHAGDHAKGSLSVLATWRLIFVILALLGGISLSFFLVWQRQLKLQLAQQAPTESAESSATPTSGNGTQPLRGTTTPPTPPLQPKVPFSP